MRDAGQTFVEFGVRPVTEHEYRVADVAFVATGRWNSADPEGYFEGAPDLVVKILSPSNTVSELVDEEALCLENRSREFWLVDLERRQVKVSTPDGRTLTYKSGQQIPLFCGGGLAAGDIFG